MNHALVKAGRPEAETAGAEHGSDRALAVIGRGQTVDPATGVAEVGIARVLIQAALGLLEIVGKTANFG